MTTRPVPPGRRARHAAAAILAVLMPLAWDGFAASANHRWYAGLVKPSFAPSPWLAVPAAAALAVAAGRAFFRVLCRPAYLPDRPGGIRIFLIALGLGAAWAWAFFVGRHPALGLALAAASVATLAMAAWRFATLDRRAGLLLLPCLLATIFVALVDVSIVVRNG